MKRLLYPANTIFPNIAAKNIQMLNMCNAFAGAGLSVTFLTFKHPTASVEDIMRTIGSKAKFKLIAGPTHHMLANEIKLFRFFLKNRDAYDYVFSRQVLTAYMLSIFAKQPFIYEAHDLQKSIIWRVLFHRVFKKAKKVVAVNNGVRNILLEKGYDRKKITVITNGVALEQYDCIKGKQALRKELRLPKGKIAMYTGHLYAGRGIEYILACAEKNPQVHFVFVGGSSEHIAQYKKKAEGLCNVSFTGFKSNRSIPKYLKAADVLLAPYTKATPTINQMCPLKLIEYMASGTPIIATDFPRIRDLASKQEIYLFKDGDIAGMHSRIQDVFKNYAEAKRKAKKAHAKVLSWNMRAQKIVRLFND